MNAELYGSSHPSATDDPSPLNVSGETSGSSRAEMENSVLDALRPLLRPKRRKQQRDAASVPVAEAANDAVAPGTAEPPEDSEPASTGPALGGDLDPFEDEFETFAAIGEDLERRSRQSATMVRLLEQHRQQLMTAEKERDAAYEKLARVVPVVQETAMALREAMDARKVDEDAARMHKLFMLNGRALDELEKVATTLFADFLWVKSAWEQYARSVEDARKLRSSLEA